MTTYALVGPGGTVMRTQENVDPTASTRAGYRWLPVEGTAPAHDPLTQVLEGPTTTVEAARVLQTWTVRDKTAQELDAEKEARLPTANDAIYKLLFAHHNDIRVLKGQAALTPAQFRALVKSLLE